jgi:hypothetical protein
LLALIIRDWQDYRALAAEHAADALAYEQFAESPIPAHFTSWDCGRAFSARVDTPLTDAELTARRRE